MFKTVTCLHTKNKNEGKKEFTWIVRKHSHEILCKSFSFSTFFVCFYKANWGLLQYLYIFMVPAGTGNQGKPGKMGRHFPVREKPGNFVKIGKVREFYSKYWKIRKNYTGKLKRMLEMSGKFVSL